MPTNPRVDDYVEKAPEFAKPILRQLREFIHKSCPGVAEDIKWSRPAFLYGGKILCGMVAFKAHCSFYIFPSEIGNQLKKGGQFEVLAEKLAKITQVADLPSRKDISHYVREAARLSDESVSNPVTR